MQKKNAFLAVLCLLLAQSSVAFNPNPEPENLPENRKVEVAANSSRRIIMPATKTVVAGLEVPGTAKDGEVVTVFNLSPLAFDLIYGGKSVPEGAEDMPAVDSFKLGFTGYKWAPREHLEGFDANFLEHFATTDFTVLTVGQLIANEHKLNTLGGLAVFVADKEDDDLVIVDNSKIQEGRRTLKFVTILIFKINNETKTLEQIDGGSFPDAT